jgi:hypothetical protein
VTINGETDILSEGEEEKNYITNSYAGIIQFHKKYTQEGTTFSADVFEYVGEKLNNTLINIATKEPYNPSDIFDLNLFVKNHLRTHQDDDANDWVYQLIVNGGDRTYVPHTSLFYPSIKSAKLDENGKVVEIDNARPQNRRVYTIETTTGNL